ncbi:MAG: type II secretion system protein [Deltaproteobacteria bacterium]|nr:type II secretion system protein [Deltaproteobacteria bacterium]
MDERNPKTDRRSLLRRARRLLRRLRPGGRAARETQRGMTLIEIMVVIAIIGLLMGAVAFLVIPRFTKAKEGTAKILVEKVYNAAAEYYTIAPPGGGCPTLEDLVREDLIKEEQTNDQWGNPLEITCMGDVVESVTSAGKDGQMGNDDDISFSESRSER